jgi:tetraacyldisaccharide 4'-kinase
MRIVKQYYIDIAEDRAKDPLALLIKFVLWFFSLGYEGVVVIRNFLFDKGYLKSAQVAVPVISLGNLTWGGSFKTSLAIFIARRLTGLRGAVVTRGYGKDEVDMLTASLTSSGTKVLVGKNRAEVISSAVTEIDYAVLDDGFQHRQLKRDCDILMINADLGLKAQNLIPCGSLREPTAAAFKRVQAVVFTNAVIPPQPLVGQIAKLNPTIVYFAAKYQPRAFVGMYGETYDLDKIAKDGAVACFCAIAYPAGFLKTLKSIGVFPRFTFIYPDHYFIDESKFRDIESRCMAESVKTLIITAKDRSRFVYPTLLKILVLDVDVIMDRPDEFVSFIRGVIDTKKNSSNNA